ncbi:MAG: coenzyme F420-0:L-glutamate ligase [Candidatus Methanofastidiosia archaeon]
MRKIEIIGVPGMPLIEKGDDLAQLIIKCCKLSNLEIVDGDVFVIAQTIVSKAQGKIFDLRKITPSKKALKLSEKSGKDAKLCELILRESKEVLRVSKGPIIVETKHGLICASAGIDHSNVSGSEHFVITLPDDPDRTAEEIRKKLEKATGRKLTVIINDTQGRPFISGAVGVTIGVSGMKPIWVRAGEDDLYGYTLRASPIATADEMASAASLLMGQASEGIPVVIIRGANYLRGKGSAREMRRERERDLFR